MSHTSVELLTYPLSVAQLPSSHSTLERTLSKYRDEHPPMAESIASGQEKVSKGTTAVVITSVTCITGISSLLTGLVVVGLPTIAKDLALDANLLLWYYSLWLRLRL
jgi:hypothetical protein